MSKSIYNLSEEYKNLFQAATDEETGELNISDEFENIKDEVNDKILATAFVIKRIESEEIAIKEEEMRLYHRRKIREASREQLKSLLRAFMRLTETDKAKNEYISVSLGRPSKRIEVTNIDIIPIEYVTIVRKASLTEIKKVYDVGESVPGTKSVTGSYRLTIK